MTHQLEGGNPFERVVKAPRRGDGRSSTLQLQPVVGNHQYQSYTCKPLDRGCSPLGL